MTEFRYSCLPTLSVSTAQNLTTYLFYYLITAYLRSNTLINPMHPDTIVDKPVLRE